LVKSKDSSVVIQTSSQSVPSTPSWLGEVTVIAHYLEHLGVLSDISERVRFARRRFGQYDLIDFAVVLLGYAISGERTLEAFYERVLPFANTFMALFGRERLRHRSTLSRFLAALGQAPVEALRTLFLEDLLARPLEKSEKPGGLWDRQGNHWMVFDVDGTRRAARQRALPCTPDRPPAQRRLSKVCAPGYTGRKRGEVVSVLISTSVIL
jgi:hypothetical protein